MKLTTAIALATSGLVMASASAQQLPVPQPGAKQAVQSPAIGGKRDYKAYQFVRIPSAAGQTNLSQRGDQVLLAGTEMVNTLSGKPALVSGIVSVLTTEDGDAQVIAQQFGLSVERVFGRLNLALLKAPEGTEMLQLRKDMLKASGVSNVDVEIVEELREVDVVSR